MPRHASHGGHDPRVERGVAQNLARQLGMDRNHLDHVAAEDRQVSLLQTEPPPIDLSRLAPGEPTARS
jgi:hypothetical protein